jgi:DNA-binding NarL/FixJ family response regulator
MSVLLVDDHPVVREGLRGMLAGEPDLQVVAEAAGAAEAVAAVRMHTPDVVLMDLGLRQARRVRPDRGGDHGSGARDSASAVTGSGRAVRGAGASGQGGATGTKAARGALRRWEAGR